MTKDDAIALTNAMYDMLKEPKYKERNILYIYKQPGCSPIVFKDVKIMDRHERSIIFIDDDGIRTEYCGFSYILKTWQESGEEEQ